MGNIRGKDICWSAAPDEFLCDNYLRVALNTFVYLKLGMRLKARGGSALG